MRRCWRLNTSPLPLESPPRRGAAEDVQWGPGVDSQYPELPSSSSSSEEEGPSPIGGIDGRQGHGSGGAAASAARRGARDPQRAQLRRRRQRQLQESQPLREQAPASMEQQQLGQGQGLWGVDLSTLRFCKARTEQKYQRWRNIRLAPVRAAARVEPMHVCACVNFGE